MLGEERDEEYRCVFVEVVKRLTETGRREKGRSYVSWVLWHFWGSDTAAQEKRRFVEWLGKREVVTGLVFVIEWTSVWGGFV